jgi:hypothetical protein
MWPLVPATISKRRISPEEVYQCGILHEFCPFGQYLLCIRRLIYLG